MTLFPAVRVSELERDLQEKRVAYLQSEERFFSTLKATLNPEQILKTHYKKIGTSALGSAVMGTLASKTAGKIASSGLLSKIATAGVLIALRALKPVAKSLFKFIVKAITK